MNEAVEIAPDNLPASGPGAMLALERSGKGLSVADIAAQLRYSPKQIEALEGDDYSRLPGTTFIRGMIRGYAKILGTPATPMLLAFEKRHVPAPVAVDIRSKRVPFPDGRARSTRVYFWLSAVIALLVIAVLYEWQFGLPEPIAGAVRTSPAEPSAGQMPEPMADPIPNQAPSDALPDSRLVPLSAGNAVSPGPGDTVANMRFEFQKDAWVEVKDRGGRVLIAQINPAGSQTVVEGSPPFTLVIGNASNVRLTYGERAVDLTQYTKVDVARFTLDQ